LRVLVLGGTRFVGRHIVEALLRGGHEVTLFHRGVTGSDLFAEVEHVHGDRDVSLDGLAGRRFDAVVDTYAYFPRQVEAAADALGETTEHYVLISSISVFREPVTPGADESAPFWELAGPEPTSIDSSEAYGALKALCEQTAERRMPGRVLAVRPGLVVGPHDYTDRFTYWPRRIGRGGVVLAAEADQPVQLIDARDLASFVAAGVTEGRTGAFNATGPAEPLTMGGLLDAARDVTGTDAEIRWAGDELLLAQGVEPWEELPLWAPRADWGFLQIDCSKAIGAGLRFRPLAETIADTFHWDAERRADERSDAMAPERERALLDALDDDILRA
jgi:nucleoside-diphosphate-sugar epimerase